VGSYDTLATVGPDGNHEGAASTTPDALVVAAKPYGTCELLRGEQPTVAQYETKQRADKVQAAIDAEAAARKRLDEARKDQYAQAREAGPDKGTFVLVQAEDLAGQGGGEVTITDKKAAAYGTCFLKWDSRGHWLDYNVEIPKDGYYKIILRYCREGGPVVRALRIDGEYPHEAARKMEMPGTGGWSNGADNWQYYAFSWPVIGEPFLVKLAAGKHTLRLENASGGGVNLDYIVIASTDTEVSRELVEK
jgi:hypothetical protein